MPGADDGLGKEAERRIRTWLDRPELGYSFDRIPDQMTGYYQISRNICDFVCYKFPYQYYIESKSTWHDRFDFSMLTDTQYQGLLDKSALQGVYALVVVLFASYQRAILLDIREIKRLIDSSTKSLNIKKIDTWNCRYAEILTIPSRKRLLEYDGDFEILTKIATGGDL